MQQLQTAEALYVEVPSTKNLPSVDATFREWKSLIPGRRGTFPRVSSRETVHSTAYDCSSRRLALGCRRGVHQAHMNEQMVLLRAVQGTWEGWRCMALEEFLQRVDLRALNAGQLLVAMVLPQARAQLPN
jgi:hypothetical protein